MKVAYCPKCNRCPVPRFGKCPICGTQIEVAERRSCQAHGQYPGLASMCPQCAKEVL